MRLRYAYVALATVALALLAGWGIGSIGYGGCEYSCPAHGACPVPATCLHHPFSWSAGVASGLIAAIVVAGLGSLAIRNNGPTA